MMNVVPLGVINDTVVWSNAASEHIRGAARRIIIQARVCATFAVLCAVALLVVNDIAVDVVHVPAWMVVAVVFFAAVACGYGEYISYRDRHDLFGTAHGECQMILEYMLNQRGQSMYGDGSSR